MKRPILFTALEDIKAGDIVYLDPKTGKLRRACSVTIVDKPLVKRNRNPFKGLRLTAAK